MRPCRPVDILGLLIEYKYLGCQGTDDSRMESLGEVVLLVSNLSCSLSREQQIVHPAPVLLSIKCHDGSNYIYDINLYVTLNKKDPTFC